MKDLIKPRMANNGRTVFRLCEVFYLLYKIRIAGGYGSQLECQTQVDPAAAVEIVQTSVSGS